MDVFTWSMPFVAEKVTKMFYDILSKTNIQNEVESLTKIDVKGLVKQNKKRGINILKNKIKFVSKMVKMQKLLREERENIIKIKVNIYQSMYGNKLPKGLLLEGKQAIEAFKYVKELDKFNEGRPT